MCFETQGIDIAKSSKNNISSLPYCLSTQPDLEHSMQLQNSQTNEQLQARDYDIGDLGFDDSAMEDQFPLSSHQYRALQPAVSASDDHHRQRESYSNRSPSIGLEERYDPELLTTGSSSSFFPSDYPGPYSSYTSIERIASEALLYMHQGQSSLLAHPSSTRVQGRGFCMAREQNSRAGHSVEYPGLGFITSSSSSFSN